MLPSELMEAVVEGTLSRLYILLAGLLNRIDRRSRPGGDARQGAGGKGTCKESRSSPQLADPRPPSGARRGCPRGTTRRTGNSRG
jgi:hypothetical protein